jgi:hypothetical protein
MLRSFSRPFSTSLSRAFPRHIPSGATAQSDGDKAARTKGITAEDIREAKKGTLAQWTLDDIVENDNDSSSAGHLYLAQQRQNLHYLRLIEHEMPKLVGECSPCQRVCQILLTRTRKPSFSQTVYPSNVRNAARCPVLVLRWRRASRDCEACPHSRRFSTSTKG